MILRDVYNDFLWKSKRPTTMFLLTVIRGGPRDLSCIGQTLHVASKIKKELNKAKGRKGKDKRIIEEQLQSMEDFDDLINLLHDALKPGQTQTCLSAKLT